MMFSNPMYASSDGCKLERVGRQKGIVKFDPARNKGEIKIIVANRYFVSIAGKRSSKEDLTEYAKAIDYKKLESQ